MSPSEDVSQVSAGRARVCAAFDSAFEKRQVVFVLTGPGWGASTAGRSYADSFVGQVAWLDLDQVEARVERARQALWDLKRSKGPNLLVLDGLDDELLPPLLQEVPPLDNWSEEQHVLVLARRSVILDDHLTRRGIPALTEADLRLSVTELSQLARALGDPYWHDGQELLRLTGGWARGALDMLSAGSLDPHPSADMFEFLRTRVIDPLPAVTRDALVRFSVIDRISVDVAEALGGASAVQQWHWLRRAQLPLTAVTDTELVLRIPLQTFLQTLVFEVTGTTVDGLRTAYLDHLATTGRFGDAIAWCMYMEDSRTALQMMEAQIDTEGAPLPVWDVFASWLAGLGEETVLSNDRIALALLQRLHDDDRREEASSLAQQLHEAHRTDAIIESADPHVRPILMLSLMRQSDDLAQFSRAARGPAGIQAASYMLAVTGGEIEVTEPPQGAWEDMAVVIRWGNFWQGRLGRVMESAGTDGAAGHPSPEIPVIVASAWAGDTAFARRLWDDLEDRARSRPLETFAGAALCIAEGDHATARHLIEGAVEVARISTASFEFAVLNATMSLIEGDPVPALNALPERIREMRTFRRLALAEWAGLVHAMALTTQDRTDEANDILDAALASMRKAGRYLFHGAALRLRAHLHELAGESKEANLLLAELKTVPDENRNVYWEGVVERQFKLDPLTVEPTVDVAGVPVRLDPDGMHHAVFDPFGWPATLTVGGKSIELRRTKYAELIALLAHSGGRVDRRRVLTKLFPEADRKRASNHLRQIIFKLRESTGIVLERADPDFIVWPETMPLHGLDVEFEERIAVYLTRADQDVNERQTFLEALEHGRGTFLEGSDLDWVGERREQLSVLFEEAVEHVIADALERGDIETVRTFGMHALRLNPYGEDLYQTMMQAELDFGSRPRGLALYRDAYTRLRELDLEPSQALRVLSARLRER